MKYLLVLFLLWAQNCLCNSPLTFTKVVAVDSSTSKGELYERARLWFANSFKDSKSVLRVSEKESGELVGHGSMKYSSNIFLGSAATSGHIEFDIKVYTKDGRYKYEITNFVHEGTRGVDYSAMTFGPITDDVACPEGQPVKNGAAMSGMEAPAKWKNNVWNDIKSCINETVTPLLASLEKAMKTPTAGQRDDW